MTDEATATSTSQAAPQVSSLPVTPESLAAIKAGLTNNLNSMYAQFTGAIRQFPINPGLMQVAFSHLDNGLLWVEKAISLMEGLPTGPAVVAPGAITDVPPEVIADAATAKIIEPTAEASDAA